MTLPASLSANTLLQAPIKKPHKTSYLLLGEWPHGRPTWRRTQLVVGSLLLMIKDTSLPQEPLPFIDLASLPSSSSWLPLPLAFN